MIHHKIIMLCKTWNPIGLEVTLPLENRVTKMYLQSMNVSSINCKQRCQTYLEAQSCLISECPRFTLNALVRTVEASVAEANKNEKQSRQLIPTNFTLI
jgi:hypothetical protein